MIEGRLDMEKEKNIRNIMNNIRGKCNQRTYERKKKNYTRKNNKNITTLLLVTLSSHPKLKLVA